MRFDRLSQSMAGTRLARSLPAALHWTMAPLSHADVIAMMERVGEITLTHFEVDWLHAKVDVEHDGPCVYAWVEEPPHSDPIVRYLGKAGSTLARRCYQHAQAFRGAGRGKSHADYLIPLIKAGSAMGIYALWPDPLPFRETMIPSHSSVEDYLLAAIQPKPVRNRPTSA